MWTPFGLSPALAKQKSKREKLEERVALKRQLLESITTVNSERLNQIAPQEDPYAGLSERDAQAMQFADRLIAGAQFRNEQDAENFRKQHEQGTFTGTAKQTGAVVGDIATKGIMAPVTGSALLTGLGAIGNVSQEARDVYFGNKTYEEDKRDVQADAAKILKGLEQGILNPEEAKAVLSEVSRFDQSLVRPENQEVLEAPAPRNQLSILPDDGKLFSSGTTQGKRIESGDRAIGAAKALIDLQEKTVGKFVDDVPVQKLVDEVYSSYSGDSDKGVIDAIFDNKVGAGDVVIEAGAEIAMFLASGGLSKYGKAGQVLGAAGKASVVGESVTEASNQVIQGMEKILERDGTITEDQIAGLIAGGVAYAGLDFAEVSVLAKAIKSNTPLINALKKKSSDAKSVKILKDTLNRTGAVASVGGKEGVIGGTQGLLEETVLQDNYDSSKIDAAKIATDATVEAIGATGISAPKEILGGAKDVVGTITGLDGSRARAAAEQSAAINSVREQFIDTGDLSVLDSEDAPLSAADKIDVILSRNSQESTPLEERITNRDAAFNILQESQAKAVELQRTISDISTRYEQDPESVTAEEVAQLDAAKAERDELLEVVNKAGDYVQQLVATTTTQDELDSVADTIQSAATPEEAQSNVDTIINAAMLTPELVSSDTVRKALESDLLTDEQRTYLENFDRTMQSVKDAEEAIETMKGVQGVSRDVFEGNKEAGWKGIKNYRQEIEAALRTGNTQLLQQSQNQLNNFLQGKQERADAFNAAYEEAMATGQRVQPLKADGTPYTYMANTGEVDAKGKPIYEERPYNIHRGSNKRGLITAINAEANALQAVKAEAESRIQLAQSRPTVTPKPKTTQQAPEASVSNDQVEATDTDTETPTPVTATAEAEAPTGEAEASAVSDAGANSIADFTLHSGGAKGADSAWDDIGTQYGLTKRNHYQKDKTPRGNTTITAEQFKEGLVKAKEAAKALGRNWSNKPYIQGLLSRNWQQVKNADAVFAIAERLDGSYVAGGTGYAVAMAVQEGKPVYAFDQSQNQWFESVDGQWVATDTPTLTPNFAGIGTRNLSKQGEQAIQDVYAKTQASLESGVNTTSQNQPEVNRFTWARTAKDGEGFEISSKAPTALGRSLSAFKAKLSDGRTIEEAYQQAKGYPSIKEGKGKPAKNKDFDYWGEYLKLWEQWAKENPETLEALREAAKGKTLTDRFASTDNNQARALAAILNRNTVDQANSQNQPEAGTRSEVDQYEAEKTRPGILPWESEDEYDSRTTVEPTTTTSTDSAPVRPERSEPSQAQAEQEYPGILPWETVTEYQSRQEAEPTERTPVQQFYGAVMAAAQGKDSITLGQLLDIYDAQLNGEYSAIYSKVKARVLKEFGKDLPVNIDPTDQRVAAYFGKDGNLGGLVLGTILDEQTVQNIANENGFDTKDALEAIVLHELIHAVTYGRIRKDPGLERTLDKIGERIKEYLDSDASKNLDGYTRFRLGYMAGDVREIPTVGLLETNVQDALKAIPGLDNKPSLYSNFIELVRKAIGNIKPSETSLLADVIDISAALIDAESTIRTQYEQDLADYRETEGNAPVGSDYDAWMAANQESAATDDRQVFEQDPEATVDYEEWAAQQADDYASESNIPEDLANTEETDEEAESEDGIVQLETDAVIEDVPEELTKDGDTLFNRMFGWFTGGKRLADIFKPRSETTRSPLVYQKDFMRNLVNNFDQAVEVAKAFYGRELTPEQVESLRTLADVHSKVMNYLTRQLGDVPANRDNTLQNWANSLLRDHENGGQLNENAVGAVSIALYEWVASQGMGTLYMEDKQINTLFKRNKDAAMIPELRELGINLGLTEGQLSRNLGKSIRQYLNFTIDKVAPGETRGAIEVNLGNLGIAIMRDANGPLHMLTAGNLDTTNVVNILNKSSEKTEIAPHTLWTFYRLRTERVAVEGTDATQEVAVDDAQRIIESAQNTGAFISKLFNGEILVKDVSFEKVTSVAKRVRGTMQKIPQRARKQLRHSQSVPHELKEDRLQDLDLFSNRGQLGLFGFRLEGTKGVLKIRHKNVEGKNNGIIRSWQKIQGLRNTVANRVEQGLNSEFYIPYFMARNGRSHMDVNTGNPQGDANHRFLIRQKGWAQTVSLDNTDLIDRFHLALGEAFDLKRDKKLNKVTLETVQAEIASEAFQNALAGLKLLRTKTELTDEARIKAENDVLSYVQAKGTNLHAFDGLAQYANYEAALNDPEATSFETDIFSEGDGIANGVAIGSIQMGSTIKAGLGKFGIYYDDTDGFAEWKVNPKNKDAYEETSFSLQEALDNKFRNLKDAKLKETLKTALAYFGDITFDKEGNMTVERGAGKQPTMITVYGAGDAATKKDFVNAYLEGVMDALEDAYAANDLARAQKIVQDYNNIQRGMEGARGMPIPKNREQILDLKPVSTQAISDLIGEEIGTTVLEAIDAKYGQFKERRTQFNTAINIANSIFTTVLDQRIKERHKELVKAGVITATQVIPEAEVNALVAELREIMPIIDTPYSKENGDLSTGLFLGSREQTVLLRTSSKGSTEPVNSGTTLKNKQKIKFHTTPLNRELQPVSEEEKAVKSLSNRVMGAAFSKVLGVAPAIMTIHSLDGFVALSQLGINQVLSVFDGFGFAMGKEVDGAKQLNKAFHWLMKNYSMYEEALKTLDRAIAYAESIKDSNPRLYAEIRKNLKENKIIQFRFKDEQTGNTKTVYSDKYDSYRKMMASELNKITRIKKELTDSKARWGQYYMEGGMHEVQPTKSTTVKKTVEQDVETITSPDAEVQTVTPPTEPVTDADSPSWNETVEIVEKSNRAAVALKRMMPKVPDRLKPLAEALLKVPNVRSIPISVSDSLGENRAGQHELRVDTETNKVVGMAIRIARTVPASYIDTFGEMGAGVITLIHEIVHGATTWALDTRNAKSKHGVPYEKKDVASQGIMLNNRVRNWVRDNTDSLSKAERIAMRSATENASELVAWGTTSEVVQGVLQRIPGMGVKKTMFDSLVELMLRAIGLPANHDSALKDVFRLYARAQAVQSSTVKLEDGTDGSNETITNAAEVSPEDAANETVSNMSTAEFFDALDTDTTDPVTKVRFNRLLKDFSLKLPLERLAERNVLKGVYSSTDVFLDAAINDRIPFSSGANAAGFDLNAQQLFIMEQIEALVGSGTQTINLQRNELDRLYDLAQEQLPLEAFGDTSTEDGRQLAQARRDWVFGSEIQAEVVSDEAAATGSRTLNRSDYLARFAGVAMAYTPMYEALNKLNTKEANKPTTVVQAIEKVIQAILDLFSKWSGAESVSVEGGKRVEQLLSKLADSRARHQDTVFSKMLDSTDRGLEVVNQKLGKVALGINKASKSAAMQYSTNKVKGTLGAIGRTVTAKNIQQYTDGMKYIGTHMFRTGPQGFLGNVLTELEGPNASNSKFHNLLRYAKHMVDQNRRHADQYTRNFVRSSFGRDLTKDEKSLLTSVYIENNLQTLLSKYGVSRINNLLRNAVARDKAIDSELTELAKLFTNREDVQQLKNQANALGYFMVTGLTKSKRPLAFNGHQMVSQLLADQNLEGNESDYNKAVEIVDRLASIYAMKHTPETAIRSLFKLMNEEGRREGANGFDNLLRLHKQLIDDARKKNFNDNPMQMINGYTKEILDPNVNFKVLTREEASDPAVRKKLAMHGYKYSHVVKPDESDPVGSEKLMYVSKIDGKGKWLSAIISLTSEVAKGSQGAEYRNRKQVADITALKVRAANDRTQDIDPSTVTETAMAPVYDDTGKITGYRYMMSKAQRNKMFRRHLAVDEVLGGMAGSTVDKMESKKINERTIDMLRKQYAIDKRNGVPQNEFVTIGPESPYPEYRELYALLPKPMREKIFKEFGGELIVRRDLVNLVFGYRELRLTNLWHKDSTERNLMENLFVQTLDQVTGGKGYQALRIGGDIWAELIREVKDILVIKNFFTLFGNNVSNGTVLAMSGVRPDKIITDQGKAYILINTLQRDAKALAAVNMELGIEEGRAQPNQAKINNLKAKATKLQSRITDNEISPLIDAGVFQTIIEDIDIDEDGFSYKERLTDKLEELTERVPGPIKTVASNLLVTRKSHIYKTLSYLTQTSDLAARYALYQHLVKNKKMRREEAVEKVVKRFVNYDVPTDPKLDWANRVGLIWFSKYFMRIQAVLVEMVREEPARMLLWLGLHNILDITTVWDSAATPDTLANRVHNPIGSILNAPEQIITLTAIDALAN